MDIRDLIGPDRVVADLEVEDKAEALKELAKRAARFTGLSADAVEKLLSAREALGSTGIGRGIAIPHACAKGLDAPFGYFARFAEPVAFDSIDGEPVDLVFLLLTPADRNHHVAALAAVSRRLRDAAVLKSLRAAETAKDIYTALTGT